MEEEEAPTSSTVTVTRTEIEVGQAGDKTTTVVQEQVVTGEDGSVRTTVTTVTEEAVAGPSNDDISEASQSSVLKSPVAERKVRTVIESEEDGKKSVSFIEETTNVDNAVVTVKAVERKSVTPDKKSATPPKNGKKEATPPRKTSNGSNSRPTPPKESTASRKSSGSSAPTKVTPPRASSKEKSASPAEVKKSPSPSVVPKSAERKGSTSSTQNKKSPSPAGTEVKKSPSPAEAKKTPPRVTPERKSSLPKATAPAATPKKNGVPATSNLKTSSPKQQSPTPTNGKAKSKSPSPTPNKKSKSPSPAKKNEATEDEASLLMQVQEGSRASPVKPLVFEKVEEVIISSTSKERSPLPDSLSPVEEKKEEEEATEQGFGDVAYEIPVTIEPSTPTITVEEKDFDSGTVLEHRKSDEEGGTSIPIIFEEPPKVDEEKKENTEGIEIPVQFEPTKTEFNVEEQEIPVQVEEEPKKEDGMSLEKPIEEQEASFVVSTTSEAAELSVSASESKPRMKEGEEFSAIVKTTSTDEREISSEKDYKEAVTGVIPVVKEKESSVERGPEGEFEAHVPVILRADEEKEASPQGEDKDFQAKISVALPAEPERETSVDRERDEFKVSVANVFTAKEEKEESVGRTEDSFEANVHVVQRAEEEREASVEKTEEGDFEGKVSVVLPAEPEREISIENREEGFVAKVTVAERKDSNDSSTPLVLTAEPERESSVDKDESGFKTKISVMKEAVVEKEKSVEKENGEFAAHVPVTFQADQERETSVTRDQNGFQAKVSVVTRAETERESSVEKKGNEFATKVHVPQETGILDDDRERSKSKTPRKSPPLSFTTITTTEVIRRTSPSRELEDRRVTSQSTEDKKREEERRMKELQRFHEDEKERERREEEERELKLRLWEQERALRRENERMAEEKRIEVKLTEELVKEGLERKRQELQREALEVEIRRDCRPSSLNYQPPAQNSPKRHSPFGLDNDENRRISGDSPTSPRYITTLNRTPQKIVKMENPSEIIHHHPVFVKDTSKYWYKPTISREQAINMLRDKPPGTFVVRDSNSFPGAFGMALKVAQPPPGVPPGDGTELVRHFLIEPSPKGVKLKGCNNEPVFGSLSALVYQHSITPLALPTKLILPEYDPASSPEHISATQALLEQGAACNVVFVATVDMESLTGNEAIRRAVSACFELHERRFITPISVHFKVSSQGITLTDNTRKLFFRRHYPVHTVIFAGIDPSERRWDNLQVPSLPPGVVHQARLFGFVARKVDRAENACHVFAELEPEQPASAVVNFINKVMLAQARRT